MARFHLPEVPQPDHRSIFDVNFPVGSHISMETEVSELQPKQEMLRSLRRSTLFLDKIFTDLVVEQIQLGNKQDDDFFTKKTWNHIRDEFNRQTGLSFTNNQLRKHLDVLQTRYGRMKSSFFEDHPYPIPFDLWAQIKIDMTKVKRCPVFEQLRRIFYDLGNESYPMNKGLKPIEAVDGWLYYASVDLFVEPDLREMLHTKWSQGKVWKSHLLVFRA